PRLLVCSGMLELEADDVVFFRAGLHTTLGQMEHARATLDQLRGSGDPAVVALRRYLERAAQ
ncbi:MAG: hypothetical protein WD079_07315, partial [Phycisphaeraceae bacterium]